MFRPQKSDKANPKDNFYCEEGITRDDAPSSSGFGIGFFFVVGGRVSGPHFAPEGDGRAKRCESCACQCEGEEDMVCLRVAVVIEDGETDLAGAGSEGEDAC